MVVFGAKITEIKTIPLDWFKMLLGQKLHGQMSQSKLSIFFLVEGMCQQILVEVVLVVIVLSS